VQFHNRFDGCNNSTCLISIDGTDCPIQEPLPFSGRWYSHKYKGPGLQYKIAVCIQTGWVVWKNGPYPCAAYPDLSIAHEKLVPAPNIGEKYVADRGYRDGREYADTPTGFSNLSQQMKSSVRERHETYNSRVNNFRVLSTPLVRFSRYKLNFHNEYLR
jgi:hypothetical protein